MPFLTLNNDDSDLATYYNNVTNDGLFAGTSAAPNVTGTKKPEVPKLQYTAFDDGLIRGGLNNVLLSVARDEERVGGSVFGLTKGEKFKLGDLAQGVLFFVRQAGLQLSNPKLETNQNNVIPPLLGGPTRQFTGAGIIASIAGTAFGLHFDRGGLLGVIGDDQKYASIVYDNNFGEDNNNIIPSNRSHNRLIRYLDRISKSSGNSVTLSSYLGGPKSVYGIGRTRIQTERDYRTIIRDKDLSNPQFSDKLNNFIPLSNTVINNFQNTLRYPDNYLKSTIDNSPFYNKPSIIPKPGYTVESRYGVTGGVNTLDSINMINIVNSKVFYETLSGKKSNDSEVNCNDAISTTKTVDGDFGRDLIKFRLEFLNNEKVGYKSGNSVVPNTDILAFRAYIDSFDDGLSAKWNSYRYMGRGEDFYVYEGYSRDISVAFTMHAHTPDEMFPLYTKLNYLISTFAPDYSSQLKMRGNIGYLTVGDYIYRQPGVYTDIKISGFFDGSWEVGTKSPTPSNLGDYELPKMLKIQLSFKPIHTFLPRKVNPTQNVPYVPFIGRDLKAYPMKSSTTNTTQTNSGTSDGSTTDNTSTNATQTNGNVSTANNNNGTFTNNQQPDQLSNVTVIAKSSSKPKTGVLDKTGLNIDFRKAISLFKKQEAIDQLNDDINQANIDLDQIPVQDETVFPLGGGF